VLVTVFDPSVEPTYAKYPGNCQEHPLLGRDKPRSTSSNDNHFHPQIVLLSKATKESTHSQPCAQSMHYSTKRRLQKATKKKLPNSASEINPSKSASMSKVAITANATGTKNCDFKQEYLYEDDNFCPKYKNCDCWNRGRFGDRHLDVE
jgi:hypothetical protein